jgi:hypothetical protein
MYVDQISHADVTRSSSGALCIEVRNDVSRAADVEITADTATESHPAVKCREHQNEAAVLTSGGEGFMHAEVAAICRNTNDEQFKYTLFICRFL